MQKTNFTFRAATLSRFMRNTRRIKQIITSNRKKFIKAFHKQGSQVLSHPFGKMAAVAAFSAILHLSAGAQSKLHSCSVFVNADSTNPIRGHLSPNNVIFATNFVDIDSDGDLDCYVTNGLSTTPFLLENRGTAQHPLFNKKKTPVLAKMQMATSITPATLSLWILTAMAITIAFSPMSIMIMKIIITVYPSFSSKI